MECGGTLAALGGCEFFREIAAEDMERILELCSSRAYEAGDAIFTQGNYGEHIFIIADGEVVLERSIDLEARKGKVIVDVLGKGKVLGCWSTLLGEAHLLMSSAVCRRPTTVMAIAGADLRRMMIANKELGFLLMERFCSLLRARIEAAYGAMEKL